MVKKYDVITMGSGLVDAFLYFGLKEKNNKIVLPVGQKILVKNIEFSVGGGGTNTASCFSRMGMKVGYLGKIGSGNNAEIILRGLKKNKVDFLGVQAKEHTGYSIVLETDKKHRTILTFKGASNNLKFTNVKLTELMTDWFYFTATDGETFKTQKKIAEYAVKKGIKIAFNPGATQLLKNGRDIKDILKHTYLLTLNKEEAEMLARNNLFKNLYAFGPKIISITNGEKEGGVYDGEFLYRYFPRKVMVSECTGAGDVFGSSLLAGFIKLKDIGKAVEVAMANAESVITKRGAQNGIMRWDKILKTIKMEKFRIKKERI